MHVPSMLRVNRLHFYGPGSLLKKLLPQMENITILNTSMCCQNFNMDFSWIPNIRSIECSDYDSLYNTHKASLKSVYLRNARFMSNAVEQWREAFPEISVD